MADAVGLGLATVGRAVGGRRPVAAETASLLSLVDSTPRLRSQLEIRIGDATTDLLLATTNAIGQGLAQGPMGLLVDAAHRLALIGEITARRDVWEAREPELHGAPSDEVCVPLPDVRRPVPLPPGPVERYGDRAAGAAMLGAATAFVVSRNHADAVAALVSGTPKGARLTREVFASTLGRLLWRRGIVPLDASALRRLDRVDTVVVDAGVLVTGRAAIGPLEPTGDTVEGMNEGIDELTARAAALLDPEDPHAVRRADGWTLGPLSEVTAAPTPALRAAARRVRRPGGVVLGLTEGHRLLALLGTEPELDGLAGALVAAAAGAGTLLVAGEGSGVAERVGAAGRCRAAPTWPGRSGTCRATATSWRWSPRAVSAALAAADAASACCARGSTRRGAPTCCAARGWPRSAVSSTPLVRRAPCRSAARVVALYGSVAAALLALSGPRRGATSRALLAVNGAAAVGMALGAWSAGALDRRPDPLPSDGTEWHALSAADTLARLGSAPDGLTEREAGRRHAGRGTDDDARAELGLVAGHRRRAGQPADPGAGHRRRHVGGQRCGQRRRCWSAR